MIDFYLDERYEQHPEDTTFFIASFVLFPTNIDDLRHTFKEVTQVRKKRRIDKLISFIEKWQSIAVITYANIPQGLAEAGQIDYTGDIPEMRRRDTIWSICVLYNLAVMCAKLIKADVIIDNEAVEKVVLTVLFFKKLIIFSIFRRC